MRDVVQRPVSGCSSRVMPNEKPYAVAVISMVYSSVNRRTLDDLIDLAFRASPGEQQLSEEFMVCRRQRHMLHGMLNGRKKEIKDLFTRCQNSGFHSS